MINKLKKLFYDATSLAPEEVVKLTGDGSNRCYYRMKAGDVSLIGTVGTSIEENRAFLLSRRSLQSGEWMCLW